jgi:UMF1 family MFS transporter
MMYDWANSAFSTTVAGALLMPYLTALAQASVGDNGVVLSLGPIGSITAKSFGSICTGLSVFLQAAMLPVFGALADYSDLKKRLLAVFCYTGAFATALMFLVQGNLYWLGGLLHSFEKSVLRIVPIASRAAVTLSAIWEAACCSRSTLD